MKFDARTRLVGPSSAAMVSSWGNRLPIVRSVQRGTFTLAAATSGTATITAVDTANSELVYLGITTDQANPNFAVVAARATLTNATTVTCTMGSNAGNVVGSYEVEEYFQGFFRSVQRGTVAVGAGASATATVTSVNMLKSRLTFMGWSLTTALAPNADQWGLKSVLTNATTITQNRVTADGNNPITGAYQLLEHPL